MKTLNRNIFLIDALGALMSGLLLAFVLPQFEIGLENTILNLLAVGAWVLAVYSFCCYVLKLKKQTFLHITAYANLLYCMTTGFVLFYFFKQLKTIGLFYFISELLIILSLALYEMKLARMPQIESENNI